FQFGTPFVKVNLRARCKVHFDRNMENGSVKECLEADRLSVAVRHGGRVLNEELFEVLELHVYLADIADSDNEFDLLALGIGPLFARAESQACLHAVDFFAPGGEGFFLWARRLSLGGLRGKFDGGLTAAPRR